MKIFIVFLSLLVVSCGQKKDTNTAKDDKSTTGTSTENIGDKKVTEKKEIGKDEIFLCRNMEDTLYLAESIDTMIDVSSASEKLIKKYGTKDSYHLFFNSYKPELKEVTKM